MAKTLGMVVVLLGIAGLAFAGVDHRAPEIDASAGVSALAMVGGACLILRARKKR
jgi:hypothetical protein